MLALAGHCHCVFRQHAFVDEVAGEGIGIEAHAALVRRIGSREALQEIRVGPGLDHGLLRLQFVLALLILNRLRLYILLRFLRL
jgi:hypothetical protein